MEKILFAVFSAKNLGTDQPLFKRDSTRKISSNLFSWFSSVFEQDQTIKEVFIPKPCVVAEIVQSLGKHKDLKNEVWNLCVKYLEPLEANNIKEYLISGYKKIEIKDSLSNFIVNYETLVKAILLFCGNTLLKISLEGKIYLKYFLDILKKKQCDKQRIEFCKFFEDFEKTKNAVRRVELWNLFKNIDKVNFLIKLL